MKLRRSSRTTISSSDREEAETTTRGGCSQLAPYAARNLSTNALGFARNVRMNFTCSRSS